MCLPWAQRDSPAVSIAPLLLPVYHHAGFRHLGGNNVSVNIETLDGDASVNCLPTSTTPRSLLCSGALNIHEYGSALPLLQLAVSSCRQDAGMVSAVVGERNLQGCSWRRISQQRTSGVGIKKSEQQLWGGKRVGGGGGRKGRSKNTQTRNPQNHFGWK